MRDAEPVAPNCPPRGSRPVRLARVILALLVVGAFATFGIYVAIGHLGGFGFPFLSGHRPPPGDASLKTLWQEHQSDFAALLEMISEEPYLRSIGDDNVGIFWLIGGEWSTGGTGSPLTEKEMLKRSGLSPERYHAYLKLLRSVGGFRVTRDDERVAVHIARAGIVPAGYIKSIVYSPDTPAPIVGDTEAYARGTAEGVCYAAIGRNWYIMYDWR